MMHSRPGAAVAAAIAIAVAAGAAEAKPFRFASSGDPATMDPHANNAGNTTLVLRQIYEPLVKRDKALKVMPGLATEWSNPEPTVWRFKLRRDVKFHDGAAFDADDAIFSIRRAMAPTSNYVIYVDTITDVRKVDDLTIDVVTRIPDPILIQKISEVRMMDKDWSEKNKAVAPQNFRQKEEMYTVRNANGTGPFKLVTYQADVRTTMTRHTAWWGQMEGNVTEIEFRPIGADTTRVAALLSGEIDFVLDPPLQDLGRLKANKALKVMEGAENRTIFFAFDQKRDELLYSSVKGRNPFKDLRVRQAFAHAIDVEAIKSRVMRGYSVPSGSLITEYVNGYTSQAEARLPVDRAKAKQLLAEAGYPNGFDVTLDCPNNRYVNDEQICQAVAAMLAQVGVRISLNAMPLATYFPKIQKDDTSFYLLGWGVPTYDALYSLQSLVTSRTGQPADGSWNYGNYANKEMDALVQGIKQELDQAKRNDLIRRALLLHNADTAQIIIHHQMIPWAMRSAVSTVHRANNQLEVEWVTVN